MRIVRNDIIPVGRGFAAINLFGVLFVRRGARVSAVLLNHESIHSRQMRELLYVPFYVAYVAEWLVRLLLCRGNAMRAYRGISFEREASGHEAEPDYLRRRRPFAQWRRGTYRDR